MLSDILLDLSIASAATGVSKTMSGPLELWRIQRQQSFIPNSTLKDVVKMENIRYLWKGNLSNVVKGIPQYSLNWALFQKINEKIDNNLISGVFAGGISIGIIYPLETTRTYLSLQTSMVINSSIMASITPLLIILFSWLIFKTPTYFMQFFGIILSIIGVLLIISKANYTNLINLNFTKGDLWMLAAVFSWGLYSVLLKKIDNTLSQLATLEVLIFFGIIFIFPFYIIESLNNSYLPKDLNEILMISYCAVFASIVSFFAWNRGVSILGANKASLFLHLIPVFSSMWAIIFLGEKFSFFHLMGTAFIIFGIVLSNTNKKTV